MFSLFRQNAFRGPSSVSRRDSICNFVCYLFKYMCTGCLHLLLSHQLHVRSSIIFYKTLIFTIFCNHQNIQTIDLNIIILYFSDYRLKKDVEALAAKLKRDCNLKRKTIKKPTQPVSESCNIVVESAGVYVV